MCMHFSFFPVPDILTNRIQMIVCRGETCLLWRMVILVARIYYIIMTSVLSLAFIFDYDIMMA
jgi:hypothetical protein